MSLTKKYFYRYFFLTIANLIAAINFNLLAKPINLVSGGSPGLSLVISKIVNISTSDIITIIYIITFVLGILFLDKKSVVGILYASIIYPIFVYLTENITDIILFNYQDIFLITIVASCISGLSNGLIYKNGFASSGMGIIAPILNKYFKVSISVANFLINTLIVIFGGYFFGFNIVLLAIVYLYISNFICNRIILGVSKNKILFIHSNKEDEIISFLKDKYNIMATVFDNNDKNKLIMIVLKNINYLLIKNDLQKIDSDIFFTTSNCYEVDNGTT